MIEHNLATVPIVDRFPDRFRPELGAEVPRAMIGAEILRIGMVDVESGSERGGLAIDYRPKEMADKRRIVLSFSDGGMFILGDVSLL